MLQWQLRSFEILSDHQKWCFNTSFRFKEGMFIIWIGTSPRIHLRKPQQMEVILPNSKLIHKSVIYDQLKNWLGEGLFTSNGNFAPDTKKTTDSFFDITQKTNRICLNRQSALI